MSALKKLMAVRMALQGTKIKETGRNTFSNYDYLQLADFLPVAQKLCADAGLCGVVSFSADIATLTLTDLDDETSRVVITSPMGSAALKGCHEVQNVGAVETYQRRYLWVVALEIVEHDALDSGPPAEKKKEYAGPSTYAETGFTKKQIERLDDLAATMVDAHNNKNDLAAIELWNGFTDFKGMSPDDIDMRNEEVKYVWSSLREYSALRSTLKANKATKATNA